MDDYIVGMETAAETSPPKTANDAPDLDMEMLTELFAETELETETVPDTEPETEPETFFPVASDAEFILGDADAVLETETFVNDTSNVVISDTVGPSAGTDFEQFLEEYEQAPVTEHIVDGTPVVLDAYGYDYTEYFNTLISQVGDIYALFAPETEEDLLLLDNLVDPDPAEMETETESEIETETETDLQALFDTLESDNNILAEKLDIMIQQQTLLNNNIVRSLTFTNIGVFLIFGSLIAVSVFRYIKA